MISPGTEAPLPMTVSTFMNNVQTAAQNIWYTAMDSSLAQNVDFVMTIIGILIILWSLYTFSSDKIQLRRPHLNRGKFVTFAKTILWYGVVAIRVSLVLVYQSIKKSFIGVSALVNGVLTILRFLVAHISRWRTNSKLAVTPADLSLEELILFEFAPAQSGLTRRVLNESDPIPLSLVNNLLNGGKNYSIG
jgi:hypothetical protein